jgi:hypothetical protein
LEVFAMSIETALENSRTWDEAIEGFELERQTIVDIAEPLKAWEPIVDDGGQFALKRRSSGESYRPTRHALNCMMRAAPGARQVDYLLDPVEHATKKDKETGEPVVLWEPDQRDADLVRHYVETRMFQADRLDQDKNRLFRTWKDGTLRAVLSDQYRALDNLWYMQVAKGLLPDAKIIRWRGNADTLQFDAYLPDTHKEGDDSGYGGGVHFGNSEIGERSIMAMSFILRMICTNGMIIKEGIGDMLRQIHRGQWTLSEMEGRIVKAIREIEPTLSEGIDSLLETKAFGVGDTPLANVFAQLAIDHTFSKREIRGIWDSWLTEAKIIGNDGAKTAFGLTAAMTRYSQGLDNERAVTLDKVAGDITAGVSRNWGKFLTRAGSLTDKQVARRVSDELAAAS